jgi:hypothetical protein
VEKIIWKGPGSYTTQIRPHHVFPGEEILPDEIDEDRKKQLLEAGVLAVIAEGDPLPEFDPASDNLRREDNDKELSSLTSLALEARTNQATLAHADAQATLVQTSAILGIPVDAATAEEAPATAEEAPSATVTESESI